MWNASRLTVAVGKEDAGRTMTDNEVPYKEP